MHDAWNWHRPRQPFLLDQKLKGAIAPPAGRDLEHPGFGAVVVKDRPHGEALQQSATCDVLGKLLDRDACLDAPDIGLAQRQLVEGNITGLTEYDLLNGFCH